MFFNKKKRRKGFTLAETLTVVAIIAILLAVAVPNVLAYYRQLKITGLDDDAKTIFMAAQSRLTAMMAAGEDLEPTTGDGMGTGTCVYTGGSSNVKFSYITNDYDSLRHFLPGGSIESQLQQNNYIIEYSTKTGAVNAVWYWEKGTEFSYSRDVLKGAAEYNAADFGRSERLKNDLMVGYYGGDGIDRLSVGQMPIPRLTLTNAEELRLDIKIPKIDRGVVGNKFDPANIQVDVLIGDKLIVDNKILWDDTPTGTVVLDSLYNTYPGSGTGGTDWVVGNQFKDWKTTNGDPLGIDPGADIDVTVVVSYDGSFVVDGTETRLLSQSATVHTNSLFAEVEDDGTDKIAKIAYGRHLQNLDTATSGVTSSITKAEQTRNIDFAQVTGVSGVESWYDTYNYYDGFTPIVNENLAEFNGAKNEIRNIFAIDRNLNGSAGLFGKINNELEVTDTYLVDARASVTLGSGNAGALVGTVADSGELTIIGSRAWVTKVVKSGSYISLYNVSVGQNGYAGGLVGVVSGNASVEIEGSFASVLETVTGAAGNSCAGGLVGGVETADGSVTVTNSYAAGYLAGANVAGGLVGGTTGNVTVVNSYAAGIIMNGSTVAGIANFELTSIDNSYAAVRYGSDLVNFGAGYVNFYGVAPNVATGHNAFYVKQTGVNYVANSGEAVSMSKLKDLVGKSPFNDTDYWYVPTGTNVNPQGLTYPYNLLGDDLADPYPYPMLASDITAVGSTGTLPMPHYGDWLENSYATSFYWELEDSVYRFYLVLSDGTTQYIASDLCRLYHTDPDTRTDVEAWGYGLIGIDRADVPFSDITEDTTSDKNVFVANLSAFLSDTSVSWNTKPENEELEDIKALLGDTNNMILLEGAKEDKYTSISTDVGYFELNLGFAAAIDVTDAGSPTPTHMGKARNSVTGDFPYQIRTVRQLDNIPDGTCSGTSRVPHTGCYEQTHDLYGGADKTSPAPYRDYTGANNFGGEYDGGGYRVLELKIDNSTGSGERGGMFSIVIGAKLRNIILYSPSGKAEINSAVGHSVGALALSSEFGDTTIDNCAVAGYKNIKTNGMSTGGLVGVLVRGSLTIKNCSSVNTLDATGTTDFVGGLVGEVRSSDASLKIEDSYAGGTIINAGASIKGVGGILGGFRATGASAEYAEYINVYSYVDMTALSVQATTVYYGIGPGTVSASGTAQYWSGGLTGKTVTSVAGVDAVDLSKLKDGVTSANQAKHTYIPDETGNDFAEGLKDQNDSAIDNPYPFTPVVKVDAEVYKETGDDIPVHYGDWPDEPAAQSFGYYDDGGGSVGFYGYIVDPATSAQTFANSLTPGTPGSGNCATVDGYCIPVERVGGTSTAPTAPTVSGITCTIDSTPVATNVAVDTSGKTYDLYKINGLEGVGATNYYNKITVGSTEYWFNPFFACEVQTTTPADMKKPQAKQDTNKFDPRSVETDNYNDKVIIRTARQLANMAEQTGSSQSSSNTAQNRNYVQLLDIDFEQYTMTGFTTGKESANTTWEPMALSTGTYDGNKFVISNLYINKTSVNNIGLFGDTKGKLTQIRLVNVQVKGRTRVGALAGRVTGSTTSIADCGVYVYATTAADYDTAYKKYIVDGESNVGGLIGNANSEVSEIKDCFAAVKVSGDSIVGGLIGNYAADTNGTLTNCYAGGHTEVGAYSSATTNINVSASNNRVGGLIGTVSNADAPITTLTLSGVCYSTCSVTGSDSKIGLLIGDVSSFSTVKIDTSTTSTAYAIGVAYDDKGSVATTLHDESDYLTSPTANLADILAVTNGEDAATADKYDSTLGASYPYLTASGAEHHGDWPELQEAVFYWEQEGTEYNFYAKGYLNNQEVTLDTLCKTHHDVNASMNANATSNEEWGYGLYAKSNADKLDTPKDASNTEVGTATGKDDEGKKFADLFCRTDSAVTMLAGGTEDKACSTASKIMGVTQNYYLNLGFGAAIQVGASSTMGQTGNPYQIRNVSQLDNVEGTSTSPNASYFRQTHDIYGGGYITYTACDYFAGHYNGGGHRILELSINGPGLFNRICGATIENLVLYSPSGNATIVSNGAGSCYGGIAGSTKWPNTSSTGTNTIKNCAVAGYKIQANGDPDNNVGGLVGKHDQGELVIENCSVVANLTGQGPNYIGGFVGYIDKGSNFTVKKCYVGGSIATNSSTGVECVGGIVGQTNTPTGVAACICNYTNVYSYMDMTNANANSYYYAFDCDTAGSQWQNKTNCYYWSGGLTGKTNVNENGAISKSNLSDLKNCISGTDIGTAIKTYGKNTTNPGATDNSYPYPEVIREVNEDGSYGAYVHYGDWPESTPGSGSPGIPGPSFEPAILPEKFRLVEE